MTGRVVAVILLAIGLQGCGSEATGVTVEMRNSRFFPSALTLPAGEQVRITLVNRDPIAHEFILGSPGEQREHEEAADISHDGAPGAASLSAEETQTITVTVPEEGPWLFGCHRPGHYAYGMKGSVKIVRIQ